MTKEGNNMQSCEYKNYYYCFVFAKQVSPSIHEKKCSFEFFSPLGEFRYWWNNWTHVETIKITHKHVSKEERQEFSLFWYAHSSSKCAGLKFFYSLCLPSSTLCTTMMVRYEIKRTNLANVVDVLNPSLIYSSHFLRISVVEDFSDIHTKGQ